MGGAYVKRDKRKIAYRGGSIHPKGTGLRAIKETKSRYARRPPECKGKQKKEQQRFDGKHTSLAPRRDIKTAQKRGGGTKGVPEESWAKGGARQVKKECLFRLRTWLRNLKKKT